MSPQAPKREADEKVENHFNGIIMAVLAIIAIAVLIAIFVFFGKGRKIIPAAHRSSPTAELYKAVVKPEAIA